MDYEYACYEKEEPIDVEQVRRELEAEYSDKIKQLETCVNALLNDLRMARLSTSRTEKKLQIAQRKLSLNEFVLRELNQARIQLRDECPVCFESFDTCVTFHCGHSFCEPCASHLVERCAICREPCNSKD